jgi:hypothetical protein
MASIFKKVVYFDRPGAQNTEAVISAVQERLKEGDIRHVVVASVTGETALKLARALEGSGVQVVRVSGPPTWGEMEGRRWPFVQGEIRKELEASGVRIVETALSTLGSDSVDYNLARYGYTPAAFVAVETLVAVGGYGLKTAIEVLLMATDANAVPPFTDVISVGGTSRGADTAIIARSTYSTAMFSGDADRRFQVREILAMPRHKLWWKRMMGWEEITHGECLE